MNPHRALLLVLGWLVLSLVFAPAAPASGAAVADPRALEFFEARIRPVLVKQCFSCHSQEARVKKKLRGGLLLDNRDGLRKGGDSGPAIVPGRPGESLLLKTLRHDGDVKMPPRQKLPDAVIADFETWIRRGAADPRTAAASTKAKGLSIQEGRKFWAYKAVSRPAIPRVDERVWTRGPIDAYILSALEAKGIRPAPSADRATLARRLYYDLLGLPPSPEEIDDFVTDVRPNAYEGLVDRLLASPHFGERWGRHWLDVARFAESLTLRGFILKEAWRYRDLVIDTFNDDDVPFDRFVREQVAGDLLPADSPEQKRRGLIATAFLALGNTNLEEQDKQQLRMDVVDEQLDTIGRAFLAQTIGCARCHDHKFDPIPTKDYYALAGILRNTKTLTHANVSMWLEVPLPVDPAQEKRIRANEQAVKDLQGKIKALRASLAKAGALVPARVRQAAADAGKLRRLEEELHTLQQRGPRRDMALSVREEPTIEDTCIHIRGSVHTLGAKVQRGFLQVMADGPPRALPSNASGRRELGEWLTRRDNPLTARVFVNRAWHWLFGAGLVRTTDNFGTVGERPSHSELLDYLATNFVANSWSVKHLVRSIVLSNVYRQSVIGEEKGREADPENRLLSRANRRRLDAECIRDTILSISGRLILDHGGPTYRADLRSDYGYKHNDTRRSVYSPVFRNALPELFDVFDFADPSVPTGRRNVSTSAPQALFLMNHPFIVEQSRQAAQRLLSEPWRDDGERLTRAYRLALCRPPSDRERRLASGFLAARIPERREAAWAQMFQVLFASVDFRHVE